MDADTEQAKDQFTRKYTELLNIISGAQMKGFTFRPHIQHKDDGSVILTGVEIVRK
tara:strand:- start:2813 stop:2980 length:168 start_codon:yes stop_codon:yes gene_type:complete